MPLKTVNNKYKTVYHDKESYVDRTCSIVVTLKLKDVAARHAKGRIVSVLEGGYNLQALARSVGVHLRALADV